MNERIIKRGLNVMVLSALCLFMAACSKKPEPNVPIDELVTLIEEKITKDYELKEGDQLGWDKVDLTAEEGSSIMEKMELDKSHLEEGVLFENPFNINASRIVLAKAKEEKDIEEIMTAFKKLKEIHKSEWENYLPDQFELTKNGVVDAHGRYVMYIVYDDPAAIKKIIDDKLLETK